MFAAVLSLVLATAPAHAGETASPSAEVASTAASLRSHVSALVATSTMVQSSGSPMFRSMLLDCQQDVWEVGHLVLTLESAFPVNSAEGEALTNDMLNQVIALENAIDSALVADASEWAGAADEVMLTARHIHEMSQTILDVAGLQDAPVVALAD